MTTESQRLVLADLAHKIAAIEQSNPSWEPVAETADKRTAVKNVEASEEDDETAAYQKLVDLVSYREHSTVTIAKRLKRAGFEEGSIDTAIERAVQAGIIDDRRYADMLIRGRLASGKGFQPIWREIEQLGIDPKSLDAYEEYEESTGGSERERAFAYLDRHPTRSKRPQQGAYRKLVSHGFSVATASAVAREWAQHQGAVES